jgi:hypothetical protein
MMTALKKSLAENSTVSAEKETGNRGQGNPTWHAKPLHFAPSSDFSSDDPSALYHANQNHDDCEHQENVYESTQRVR